MAKRIENTKRKKKQVVQQQNQDNSGKIYESAEALQEEISKTQEFVENNQKMLSGAIVAVMAVIAIFFGFKYYQNSQNESAQVEMFPAVFFFEKDSLGKALDGDANTTNGLVAVADDYGMSNAGNLASYYTGMGFLKQGEFDKAIDALNSFSSSDYVVQARAYALLGDAYSEKENYSEAVSYYKKAAGYNPNKQFTPGYLMKLALAYELSGNNDSAKETYQDVIDNYPAFADLNLAKKYMARL